MNSVAKKRLTAPCGLDCYNCEIYDKNITEEMKKQKDVDIWRNLVRH